MTVFIVYLCIQAIIFLIVFIYVLYIDATEGQVRSSQGGIPIVALQPISSGLYALLAKTLCQFCMFALKTGHDSGNYNLVQFIRLDHFYMDPKIIYLFIILLAFCTSDWFTKMKIFSFCVLLLLHNSLCVLGTGGRN